MVIIRVAEATDQQAIARLVQTVRLNPQRVEWTNFIIAEVIARGERRLVGAVQLRPHPGGSRELASLAVDPAYQGQKIATVLVQALLSSAPPPLYVFLICDCTLTPFYARFGFEHVLTAIDLPPTNRQSSMALTTLRLVGRRLRREICRYHSYWVTRVSLRVTNWLLRRNFGMVPMVLSLRAQAALPTFTHQSPRDCPPEAAPPF